ncbi:hypothetical protein M0R45_001349 [Rubus argutus]|uniref:Uncharacterized protein n=1 Tax=Rubus argutus TaxID=59490 RepID=A0AAW1VJ35_RUBAR
MVAAARAQRRCAVKHSVWAFGIDGGAAWESSDGGCDASAGSTGSRRRESEGGASTGSAEHRRLGCWHRSGWRQGDARLGGIWVGSGDMVAGLRFEWRQQRASMVLFWVNVVELGTGWLD